MKGRKSIPGEVKILQGTEKKCRKRETMAVEKVSKVPPPPAWFTKLGKKIYKDVAGELSSNGVLQKIGLPILVSYVHQIALHLQMEQELVTEGKVIEGKKGPFVNPKHNISMDALDAARRIASEYGITPASQSRIMAPFIKGAKNESDKDFD
jgi:P27 family predicted phage terminase small subunit